MLWVGIIIVKGVLEIWGMWVWWVNPLRERERERWVLGKELLGRFIERERESVCFCVGGKE